MSNPFTPTFGIVPPYLAGRDQTLARMRTAFQEWKGNPNLSTILIGPRGSGKTAMLSCISDIAREHGWLVADTVARTGMLEDILQRASDSAAEHIDASEKKQLTGLTIGNIFGLSWSADEKVRLNWRSRIGQLLKALNQRGIGLLITVDEVRADVDEMIQLASVYQLLIRDGYKVSLVMAGLPAHVSDLVTNDNVSFLRRSRQNYLGRIPDSDIRCAFLKTVESGGKSIDPQALDLAVTASDGFAYMMQLVGYQMWEMAGAASQIGQREAVQGIQYAEEDFRQGVLKSTYQELSDGDIRFLEAMLQDPEVSILSDISGRLGRSTGYASTYKKRLLQAGIIEETARSRFRFCLPGFRDYLKELHEQI
ncbi:MAG: ATP-binding protein [Firmicutes bacterium]|nr:ATP-binding protein [Bacillota bacterium]